MNRHDNKCHTSWTVRRRHHSCLTILATVTHLKSQSEAITNYELHMSDKTEWMVKCLQIFTIVDAVFKKYKMLLKKNAADLNKILYPIYRRDRRPCTWNHFMMCCIVCRFVWKENDKFCCCIHWFYFLVRFVVTIYDWFDDPLIHDNL